LKDMVLAFPFSPSDTVVRREWMFKVGLFDPDVHTAEDTDFPCRLALAGCQFAGIDRALNYRRYHSGRGRKNLPGRIDDVRQVQAAIFADPRCPEDVKALGRMAILHHLIVIVSLALIQNETELAHKYIRELVELDLSVIGGAPCELIEFMLSECIADESENHEVLLHQVLAQFPNELSHLSSQYDWAARRGYVWKGIRAIMWGREADGHAHFARAIEWKAHVDESLMQLATYHLLGYEIEFGIDAVMNVLSRLKPYLNQLTKRGGNELEASYLVNRAFDDYQNGTYKNVPSKILRVWKTDPRYLSNRGVLSIFLRSMMRSIR